MKISSTDMEWSSDLKSGYIYSNQLSEKEQNALFKVNEHLDKGNEVNCDLWVVSIKNIVVVYKLDEKGSVGWRFKPTSESQNIEPGCIGTVIYIWKESHNEKVKKVIENVRL